MSLNCASAASRSSTISCAITRDWLWRYNHRRTHDSLHGMTPVGYARSGTRPGTGEKQGESRFQTSLL